MPLVTNICAQWVPFLLFYYVPNQLIVCSAEHSLSSLVYWSFNIRSVIKSYLYWITVLVVTISICLCVCVWKSEWVSEWVGFPRTRFILSFLVQCDSFGTRPKKMRISQRLVIRFWTCIYDYIPCFMKSMSILVCRSLTSWRHRDNDWRLAPCRAQTCQCVWILLAVW